MLNLNIAKNFIKSIIYILKKIYIFFKKRFLYLILILICLLIFEISRDHDRLIILETEGYRPRPKIKNNNLLYSNCYSAFKFDNIQNTETKNFLKHPECVDEDWVILNSNSSLLFNYEYLNKNHINIKSCEYSSIKWYKDDFSYKISDPIEIFHGDKLNNDEEFFQITCTKQSSFFAGYKSAFARIFKRRIHKKKETNIIKPINVFFLGFDSVSRENWLSNLPKSSNFLLKVLNSTVLNGYNIVGDGTPAALIPLLTSKHEHQLPNTIKNTEKFNYVDQVYPFIWRNYSDELGYATLYAEDWSNIGTFQYRMVGMKEPPTTHYMRPFHSAILNEGIYSHSNQCIKGRSVFTLNIQYAEDFMNIYKENGFFGFMFLNEYSHDSNDRLGMIDDELHDFLERFYLDKSLSSNTILVLFADHGARFSNIRKSVRGLLQERNPFFSIYLPEFFKNKYPTEYDNLKSNWDKLTTPMDIHKTFTQILNLELNKKIDSYNESTAISLFDRISAKRNCADAGIDPHWCACLKRSELYIDPNLVKIGKIFVNYLNTRLLGKHLKICHKLKLDSIDKVFLLNSYIKTEKKKDEIYFPDLRSLNFLKAPKVETNYEQLFFQLKTKPNNGIYEFTVVLEINLKSSMNTNQFLESVKINEKSISRINKYGNSSSCINQSFPDLRKYCFCK